MSDNNSSTCFFLGANTPYGFVSHFRQILDPKIMKRAYIIKSGPGTGKSTMMKKISGALSSAGYTIELIYCSSDPNSLDGFVCPELGVCMIDGTSPHVEDPKYPGAFETIVDLFVCMDKNKLYDSRERIIELFRENSSYHTRATRFLSAAGSLINDSYRIVQEFTDESKAKKYAMRLVKKELPNAVSQTPGHEHVRFLSAVTGKGIVFYNDNIKSLCKNTYILHDNYGASSRILLSTIRNMALELGYDIYSCYCPISPNDKIEHIIIPKLKLGFFTSNKFHTIKIDGAHNIHAQRFTDNERLKLRRQRMNFNYKASNELITEASRLISLAKGVHDILEDEYISSTSFEITDSLTKGLIDEIISLSDDFTTR